MNRALGTVFNDEVEIGGGWRHVKSVASPMITAIIGSYWKHINDSLGVNGFLALIPSMELFVSHDGWVLVSDMKPGFSAALHAAKWNRSCSEGPEHFDHVANWIAAKGRFPVFNLRMADHAEMAMALVKQARFEESGIIPNFDTYQGEIHSLRLFTRINQI